MPAKKMYGWRPDLPDHRDFVYGAPLTHAQLPPSVDLRGGCPPVYDQGELGSCTANALSAAFDFDLKKQTGKGFLTPSRLFIYFNERFIEHTVSDDAGAMIRDGVKTLRKQGVCAESLWPYDDANPGPFQQKPPSACFKAGLEHQLVVYRRVPRVLRTMKGCLADGYPFVFGFTVYESFESPDVAKTGTVQMPKPSESALGGHAVVAVGYDDESQRFMVRNSWGVDWGLKGYFTMPYGYLLDGDLADDFWTLRSVEA